MENSASQVLNAAMLYWPMANTLYVEGYALDRFAEGSWALQPVHQNKVGVALSSTAFFRETLSSTITERRVFSWYCNDILYLIHLGRLGVGFWNRGRPPAAAPAGFRCCKGFTWPARS
jgi:hypothetical protein